MGKAYFDVSNELLCSLLNLPKGAKVIGVFHGADNSPHAFCVYVEHPDLPEVAEGDDIALAHPTFRKGTSEAVEFEGWGL